MVARDMVWSEHRVNRIANFALNLLRILRFRKNEINPQWIEIINATLCSRPFVSCARNVSGIKIRFDLSN